MRIRNLVKPLDQANKYTRVLLSEADSQMLVIIQASHSNGANMPYLKLETNQNFSPESCQQLLKSLSKGIADILGKSENYVMISLETAKPMLFSGNGQTTAFVELKSLGLPEEQTATFSRKLCSLIEAQTGIKAERIYIEFSGSARHMWGWNNKTF